MLSLGVDSSLTGKAKAPGSMSYVGYPPTLEMDAVPLYDGDLAAYFGRLADRMVARLEASAAHAAQDLQRIERLFEAKVAGLEAALSPAMASDSGQRPGVGPSAPAAVGPQRQPPPGGAEPVPSLAATVPLLAPPAVAPCGAGLVGSAQLERACPPAPSGSTPCAAAPAATDLPAAAVLCAGLGRSAGRTAQLGLRLPMRPQLHGARPTQFCAAMPLVVNKIWDASPFVRASLCGVGTRHSAACPGSLAGALCWAARVARPLPWWGSG